MWCGTAFRSDYSQWEHWTFRETVFKSLDFPCVASMEAFKSTFVCLTSLRSLWTTSSHDGYQAVRLFHIKLVEEHADCGTTQCADESVRTAPIRRMVRRIRCNGNNCNRDTIDWSVGRVSNRGSVFCDGNSCTISSDWSVVAVDGEVGCVGSDESCRVWEPSRPNSDGTATTAEMALSLSSVGMDVLVVMTATGTVAILPPTEMALSLSSARMGVLVVMTAAGSENPLDPAAMAVSPLAEMALSLSSVGMGVPLVVMTSAGYENPWDPAAMAISPPAEMALSLSSVMMVVSVVMAAAGSKNPRDPAVRASSLPNDTVLSLLSRTMVVPAAVASADGATLLLMVAVLSLS